MSLCSSVVALEYFQLLGIMISFSLYNEVNEFYCYCLFNSSVKFSEGFFFHDEKLELAMVHIYQYAKKGKIFNKFCA